VGGVWSQVQLEDVATPEGFARDPERVHAFYNARRVQAAGAEPNAAHRALARLQREAGAVLVTQNVDALHEAAGAEAIHMHGRLDEALCAACGHRWPAPMEMSVETVCPACGAKAARPAVVWFGEIPERMEEIGAHLAGAELFAAVGTSGAVWPAAGLAAEAVAAGAHTVELNLAASEVSGVFDEHRRGPATEVVPAWVEEVLALRRR
jgi:NAD-dependent deacetylase